NTKPILVGKSLFKSENFDDDIILSEISISFFIYSKPYCPFKKISLFSSEIFTELSTNVKIENIVSISIEINVIPNINSIKVNPFLFWNCTINLHIFYYSFCYYRFNNYFKVP